MVGIFGFFSQIFAWNFHLKSKILGEGESDRLRIKNFRGIGISFKIEIFLSINENLFIYFCLRQMLVDDAQLQGSRVDLDQIARGQIADDMDLEF